MSQYTTLIIDYSEVLFPGFKGTGHIIESHTGIPASDFLEAKQKTMDHFLAAMRGELTEQQYLQLFLKRTNWVMSPEQLGTFVRRNLDTDLENSAFELLIQLLKGNYHLVLLSDQIREWTEYIKATRNELAIFDQQIFSFDCGMIKSDPWMFPHALDVINTTADHCLFIDDSSVNIAAAEKCGIKSILYVGPSDLKQQLARCSIYV